MSKNKILITIKTVCIHVRREIENEKEREREGEREGGGTWESEGERGRIRLITQ